MKKELLHKTREELLAELDEMHHQLDEMHETINAIRTGQIDALVVHGKDGPQLYTLKSADQTYRVFIEKMTEGAITLNPEGIILYSNSQFARMVNRPLSQVIGMSFESFVDAGSAEQYRGLFSGCWAADCKGEIELISDRQTTAVQLSLTTLEMEDGVSLSIILTDLTSQKEAQKQLQLNNEQLEDAIRALEISNHDLQQFASVASHDLQEPLRKIHIFSNLLWERQKDLSPDAQKFLEKIIDSSGRMKTLIIDILNYSKLSANSHNLERIDLNELVGKLLEDFELIIEEKKALIHVDKLPRIEVNGGQIRQVFQNIISNALKFSRPDKAPVIDIKASRLREKSFESKEAGDGPFCMISIEDNGIGFDEKYLANIFTLFERLNSKDRYEGTGIGMAIAKKIVEKHNGLITAESKEDHGAIFRIILPMTQKNQ